jgi:hypothetical protein
MDWDPDFLARSAMFEPLRAHATGLGAHWPTLAELQALLDRRVPPVRNAGGLRLRVVPQARRPVALEDGYEARVFLRGELQSRERNWHDLLNALVWLAFPRAKAALNERHFFALEAQRRAGARNRGPAQDALTLFDEGGVIVAASDDSLLKMIRAFEWKELFWGRRNDVRSRMRFIVFGHALYEKALAPFTGITARGILLGTSDDLLRAPPATLLADLDARAASLIGDPAALSGTRDLAPVPVLGVPGWCPDNDREEYYDNVDYFRPGRREG